MEFKNKVKDLVGIKRPISWEKFFEYKRDPYKIYEILPSSSVRNNQAYVLGKVIASLYRPARDLKSWFVDGKLLTLSSPYRFNFRIVMRAKSIGFYVLLPTARADEIIRKIEGIYDSNITVTEVTDPLPQLDPKITFCTELHYRRHNIFSLDTDRGNNYPLPSLLTAVRTLEGEDVAIFDAMLEPGNRAEWLKEARDAHNLLEKGFVPEVGIGGKLFTALQQAFYITRDEIISLTRITKKQQEEFLSWKKDQGTVAEARRIREEMSAATRRKQDDEILRAWLRVAVQSEDPGRRRTAAYTLANSWKDISGNNELERYDVPSKLTHKYVKSIEDRATFSIKLKPIKVTPEEAGKFMQLPGAELLQEFPEINSQKFKTVQLPGELTQDGIKGVVLGWVEERGTRKRVLIPLEAYDGVQLKAVYDALCTASFGQGKQGSGKSEGYGSAWAYHMMLAGFTVIIIDTADGQVLRNFIDALPEDYPEDKIHAISFDNKSWPVAANWSDVMGRTFAEGDEELQALEISERITQRFVDFINSLTSTGEFTDRMSQYVTSCMRAITTKKAWDFLDLELALTSPAYREELLQLEDLKSQPDVLRDLQTLQERAAAGKEGEIINPILNRIRTLSGSQLLANLFYQPPKLTDEGKPVLDLRSIMDNKEGGYGHVVAIHASSDAWGDNQATILGFMLDKINFNAFSRVDTDQGNRKPCLVWVDEPHKVIKSMEARLAGTSVEFRKYRVKNLFTGHSIDQMGAAANALLDGGAQITSYKTERLNQFTRFAHNFKPYEDAKALYEALPEKWKAINSVRLPSGNTCPAFIADMAPPPKPVKDRTSAWQKSTEKYGRPWKEVRDGIQNKRSHYEDLNKLWYEGKKEDALQQKAIDAEKLRKEKEALKKATG